MTSDESTASAHDVVEEHDLGLSHDLPRIIDRQRLGRRRALRLLGGVGVVAAGGVLAACEAGESGPSMSAPSGGPPQGGGESDADVAEGEIPEETAGPFPGDGSNGVNVLSESGVVRRDITASFGDASGVAEGIPVTLKLKVYDLSGEDVTPLAGAAIYVWHCDREGRYSMYSESVVDENYLRGVQTADDNGLVEFRTIFPGCYAGRWPHVHFVYATEGYEDSVTNLAQLSLASDNVFSDGYSLQLATVTGSVEDGYTVRLNVPV